MSRKQWHVPVTEMRESYNLKSRSVYCVCKFLKPLVLEQGAKGPRLIPAMAEFVTEETAIEGDPGIVKGANTAGMFLTTAAPSGRFMLSYKPASYAGNYRPGDLVRTAGRELPGFALAKGQWSDYQYVKVLKPAVGWKVIPGSKMMKPLVATDRGVGETLEGGIMNTFGTTTGRYFRSAGGSYYVELYVTKNNEAFLYRADFSRCEYVPVRGELLSGEKYYFSAGATQESYFNPPSLMWLRLSTSVGIEGYGQCGRGDENAPLFADGKKDNGGGGNNSLLPLAMLLGLAALG